MTERDDNVIQLLREISRVNLILGRVVGMLYGKGVINQSDYDCILRMEKLDAEGE